MSNELSHKEAINLWVQCNAKNITKEMFYVRAHTSFDAFTKDNKPATLRAWGIYHQELCNQFRVARRKQKECTCKVERQKKANSFRVSNNGPQRLWKCPTHGNCFVDVATPHQR